MVPSSDLLDHYKLEAHQVGDSVIHYSYRTDRACGLRKVKVDERWDNVRPIGYGSFGEVWQQTRKSSNEQRAVKVLRKQQMKSWGINYEREIEALAKFDKAEFRQEEVIVQFFGWWESEHSIHLAMEYFEKRDLSTFISEAKTSEQDAKEIAGDLLQALVMIHSQGFTHRDLKPQNIFVVQTAPNYWVKLGDFGISKRISSQSTALRTEVGTRAFSAPETTPDDYEETFQYTNAVDMWSLGCVIYNVLAHSLPYQNSHAKRFPFPTQPLKDRVSDQGIDLLECLLRVDPCIRWTAQKAAKHPWLEASCEASSTAVIDTTDDANSFVQLKGPNENQNQRHHSDSQVDMPTVISSMEKTRLRPADLTEAPIKHSASQSSKHHEKTSQTGSSSNNDNCGRPVSNTLISPSRYSISDSFREPGTGTLKPPRARHRRRKDAPRRLDEGDATKTPTASPVMPTIISRSLNTLVTSYSSSSLRDEGARRGDPLVKVHPNPVAVRRSHESEEQSPEKMELVTVLRDLYEGEGCPEQYDIARAVELICTGVDLEMRSDGMTALHFAVLIRLYDKQSSQLLDQLLERGADVDAHDENGFTALHHAIIVGLVMKLIKAPVAYNTRGHWGQAFILGKFISTIDVDTHMLLSEFGQATENAPEVVRQLLKSKADVNAKDFKELLTPLHFAALYSGGEYMDMLLAAGARVNEVDDGGWTALHFAACVKDQNIAKKLILAGVDMDVICNSGYTALDFARRLGSSGVVEVIEEAQRQLRRQ